MTAIHLWCCYSLYISDHFSTFVVSVSWGAHCFSAKTLCCMSVLSCSVAFLLWWVRQHLIHQQHFSLIVSASLWGSLSASFHQGFSAFKLHFHRLRFCVSVFFVLIPIFIMSNTLVDFPLAWRPPFFTAWSVCVTAFLPNTFHCCLLF